jgi:hypothetical protein
MSTAKRSPAEPAEQPLADRTTPIDPSDAAERISAAEARLAELRREDLALDAAFQAAIEDGDAAAMRRCRDRRAQIADEQLVEERRILVAKVALAAVAVERGRAAMEAAYGQLQEAAAAEQSGLAAARERRSEQVAAGTIGRAQYQEAVDRDAWDATATRRRLTGEAAGTRSALADLQQALERAEGALEAHRRQTRLAPDDNTPAPELGRVAALGPGGGAPALDAAALPPRLGAVGVSGQALELGS